MASHGKIGIPRDLLDQAVAEAWSLQTLAERAGVSRYVATRRCKEAGVTLRRDYKPRGGNRTGRKNVIARTSGVAMPSRVWFRTRLSEQVADNLAEMEAMEMAHRLALLAGARAGDAAAAAALAREYRCRLVPVGAGDGGSHAGLGR